MMNPSAHATLASPEILRVIREAFGDAPVEGISPLPTGRSGSTVLELTTGGRAYVLRRHDPSRPMHRSRAEREIACLRIASERGVAPPLRHVDGLSCITIVEKVAGTPFGRSATLAPGRLARLVDTLRRLHEGPPFPDGMPIASVAQHFHDSLRRQGATGLPESILRAIAEVSNLTERFAHGAPCHYDLNPGNILETANRTYFVDWDTACAGDPFVDLAQLGVFALPTPEARGELLREYLGREPSAQERARASLARVLALAFYAAAFMHVSASADGSTELTATPLPIPELLANLGRGRAAPDVVASSLHEAMLCEVRADAYAGAKELLG